MQAREIKPDPPSPLFREPSPERSFPVVPVAIAAVVIAVVVIVLVLAGRRHGSDSAANRLQQPAAYASNLVLSNLQMSESGSMSGGKQTYIEGKISNHGTATVTGITVQAIFANDANMSPQIETEPLNVIYMRQPYVDTHPVSASPLAPGAQEDFRLIYEDVNSNWNGQLPQLRIIQVSTR
jgi:hypothetical protein